VNDLDLLREWRRPAPPTPTVRARALDELEALFYSSTAPVRRPRTRRRLAVRVAVALFVTVALVTGAVVWAQRETDRRFDAVGRIHLPEGTLSGSAAGRLPTTFLVVGSDSRAGLNDPAFGNAKDQPGERADTMILVRVTRDGAAALWIPRDLVDATGANKLNAALNSGPEVLIAALHERLGVTIDRYVAVRFRGFERIVDALGGVRMEVPYPARDLKSGLAVPVAGCTSFDGVRALQFARSRSLQYSENGFWKTVDPVPDIGRIGRQQMLVRAIASKARRTLTGHPRALLRTVDAIIPNLRIDSGTSRSDLVHVARALLGLGPGSLQTATLPWKPSPQLVGGQQVLDLADGGQVFALRFAEARKVTDLDALLEGPVTSQPASPPCR
jgi:LCP family protein required for cell wall assembly